MVLHRRAFANALLSLLLLTVFSAVSPTVAQDDLGGLTLQQVRDAYGITPLLDRGIDGSGQNVAIVTGGNYGQSDVEFFAAHYQLPTPTVEHILAPASPELPAAEWTMDVEIVLALAPRATILVYDGFNILDPTVLAGKTPSVLSAIIEQGRANIITMSYDKCEFALSDNQAKSLQKLTEQIHAAGITFFKGAGDGGAYWCAHDQANPDPDRLAVGAVSSDPYVTAVGGTTLTLADGLYASESAWSSPADRRGTGGGISSRWTIPDYQRNYLLSDENPTGMRQVPDVSADADINSGFPFYCTVADSTCQGWQLTRGNSAAGPLWAGGTALVNQYLAEHLDDLPGAPIQVHGPEDFYWLAAAYAGGEVAHAPFHDVAAGDNLYYKARSGYDLTTGLGTPDFYAIALDLEQLYRAQAATATAEPATATAEAGN
ncbi:MAG: S53 family peptidase [Chloroflexota bacterium]